MSNSETADDLARQIAAVRADVGAEAAISEEMERRDAERLAQRSAIERQAGEERTRHMAEGAELLRQLERDADQLRNKRRRLSYMVIAITLIAGVVLVWASTERSISSGFVGKLAEILGGAMLVATTIGLGVSVVSDVLNEGERQLQRKQGEHVERILDKLIDLEFRNTMEDLDKVAAKIADAERQRALYQVQVNRFDKKRELTEAERRMRDSLQELIKVKDVGIERLRSSDSWRTK
jgi:hypothetical protein